MHLHATRAFLGVGRPHPAVGLKFEIEMLPEVERISMEDMGRLSLWGTGQMLRDSTWRAVKVVWKAKAQEHSKLGVSHDV